MTEKEKEKSEKNKKREIKIRERKKTKQTWREAVTSSQRAAGVRKRHPSVSWRLIVTLPPITPILSRRVLLMSCGCRACVVCLGVRGGAGVGVGGMGVRVGGEWVG